jgi:ankyrin repeat protein
MVRVAAIFVLGLCVRELPAQAPAKVDFKQDIQPLFREHCIGCHGPSQQMGNMRLDRRSSAMAVRGGTVIGPGNAAGSRLYMKLAGTRAGTRMPPTGPLPPEKIAVIRNWIDQGAEWPDDVSGDKPPQPVDANAQRMLDALRAGDRKAFEQLLSKHPEAINLRGSGGATPLMYAALYGSTGSVLRLLDLGAKPNLANDVGATALMWSIDDVDKTRLLLERGADPNAVSDEGRLPLSIAFGKQNAAPIVKLLLAKGAKTDTKLSNGRNLFAGVGGDEAVLRVLLEHGVDVKQLAGGLSGALATGCATCVDLLIKSASKSQLSSALMSVATAPDTRAIKTLLDLGADPKLATQPTGFTALIRASGSETPLPENVRLLIERGAPVNVKIYNGMTALDFALLQGHSPVIELLRKSGAEQGNVAQTVVSKPSLASSPRAAVDRSIPLLQRSDVTFIKKSGCVSCHNNNLTAMTVALLRERRVPFDESIARSQVNTIASYIEANRELYLQGVPIAGGNDTTSYILIGLAAEGHPPDRATDAMAHWLKGRQRPDGHWTSGGGRPPLEASEFQTTATVMRSLQVYAPKPQRELYERSIQRAAEWLATSEPKTTEDRTFQLLGLAWGGGNKEVIRKRANELLAAQQADGGWAQISSLSSDAYATGQALVSLKQAGVLSVGDAAYKRGVEYLMKTQLQDGSWYVRSRTLPFQPYFESDFPHGTDQFISASATNWATMALAHTIR